MLLEFSVGNYRSFHQPVTLSLLASKLKDNPEGVFTQGKLDLLRAAAIYGANASGKSNLVRALMTMRRLVLNSANSRPDNTPLVETFALETASANRPAYFQVVFWAEGKRYRYGFEMSAQHVHSEWLYHATHRETRLFVREGQTFEVATPMRREAAPGLQERTRPDALFLSVLAQFNGPTATRIQQWFKSTLAGISGLQDESYAGYTLKRLQTEAAFKQRVVAMLGYADLNIADVSVSQTAIEAADMPEPVRRLLRETSNPAMTEFDVLSAEVWHETFDGAQPAGRRALPLDEESAGTQKFLFLLGPVFDVLDKGKVLVVDELEARLHPLLTRELVQLFNTAATNPHHAQLIFVTHDDGLLNECGLRRDQVWFVQKNRYGASELYSLAEMNERSDASYLKNYLLGRYGAVPRLHALRAYVAQVMGHGMGHEMGHEMGHDPAA